MVKGKKKTKHATANNGGVDNVFVLSDATPKKKKKTQRATTTRRQHHHHHQGSSSGSSSASASNFITKLTKNPRRREKVTRKQKLRKEAVQRANIQVDSGTINDVCDRAAGFHDRERGLLAGIEQRLFQLGGECEKTIDLLMPHANDDEPFSRLCERIEIIHKLFKTLKSEIARIGAMVRGCKGTLVRVQEQHRVMQQNFEELRQRTVVTMSQLMRHTRQYTIYDADLEAASKGGIALGPVEL